MLKWTTRTQQSRKLHDLIRRLLRIAMELSNSRDTEGTPWTFSLPLMIISRLKMLSLTGNFPNFAQMAWGPGRVWPQQCTGVWRQRPGLTLSSTFKVDHWSWDESVHGEHGNWCDFLLVISYQDGFYWLFRRLYYIYFGLEWVIKLSWVHAFLSLHNRVINPSPISKESFKS